MDPVVARLERLEQEFAALCVRLEALEVSSAAVVDEPASPAAATATASTPYLPGADLTQGDSVSGARVSAPIVLAPASRAQPAPPARVSLEDQLGGEWLNWLGVGISILAVGFALKWGYDRGVFQGLGTLSAPVRLGLGWALGVCLLLAGERMWRELPLYAQGLLGAGIAVLHVTTRAGHGYFHVLPAAVATLILAGVNTLAIGLAVRRDAGILLWLGIIFAYVGPLVLGPHRETPASLFLYVTALNGTILGVSFFRRWVGLRLAAFCAAALLYAMWLTDGYSASHAPAALWFVGLNTLVFLGLLVAGPIRRGDACDQADLPLAVLTPVLAVPALLHLLNALGHPHPGWVLFLLAALYWSAARLVHVRRGAGAPRRVVGCVRDSVCGAWVGSWRGAAEIGRPGAVTRHGRQDAAVGPCVSGHRFPCCFLCRRGSCAARGQLPVPETKNLIRSGQGRSQIRTSCSQYVVAYAIRQLDEQMVKPPVHASNQTSCGGEPSRAGKCR